VINRSRNSLPGLKKGIALSGTTTCCPVRDCARPARSFLAEKTQIREARCGRPWRVPRRFPRGSHRRSSTTSDRYSVGLRSAIRSTSSDLITGYPKLSATRHRPNFRRWIVSIPESQTPMKARPHAAGRLAVQHFRHVRSARQRRGHSRNRSRAGPIFESAVPRRNVPARRQGLSKLPVVAREGMILGAAIPARWIRRLPLLRLLQDHPQARLRHPADQFIEAIMACARKLLPCGTAEAQHVV